MFELTNSEALALEALRTRAIDTNEKWWGLRGLGPAWATAEDFAPVQSAQYRTKEGVRIRLRAPIDEVAAVLARALKPNKTLLTAMRFASGKIAEVPLLEQHPYCPEPKEEEKKVEPEAKAEKKSAPPAAEKVETALVKDKPEKAVTVAKPVIGCPVPEFPEADVRASQVLESFLTEEQKGDYRRHNAFVCSGADSGHRYLVQNREARVALAPSFGGLPGAWRQLFDIDEQRALCVHDWDVPPPEEMLALMLCVTLPGRESYIRALPNTFGHG